MEEPVKNVAAKDSPADSLADEVELNEQQRELLSSLHKSFQQAARGETRPFREFLQELRLEREAETNASRNSA